MDKSKQLAFVWTLGLILSLASVLYIYVVVYNVVSGQFEVVSPTVNNYRGGMRANYTVQKCSLLQRQGEIMLHSKTYYIAAMEMDWDYSPNRTWETEMFRGMEK